MSWTKRSRAGARVLLALGALAATTPPGAVAGPGVLATDTPVRVRDGDPAAPDSLVAGATTYLVRGDFDGDGAADVVNVTPRGAQVLLCDRIEGGAPRFRLAQDLEVLYGEGGGAIDIDSDGDIDLVLGDVRSVVVAENDGAGRFRVVRVLGHGFRQPAVAIPFLRFTAPDAPGNAVRVVLGASAENVTRDHVRRNRERRPVVYVLERTAAGWRVVQALDALNLDGAAARDFDGDGDTDLVLTDRSGRSGTPIRAWEAQGDTYARADAIDTAGYDVSFGFAPAISDRGDIAIGSWHAAAFFARAEGTSWSAPATVAFEISGTSPRGDASATAFADMDLDGAEDLVAGGSSNALELLSFDAGEVTTRFRADPADSAISDLVVANWDGDATGAPDVLTGGAAGLWFHRNANGSAPVAPAPRKAAHALIRAARSSVSALAATDLASDEARSALATTVRHLGSIADGFVADGVVPGPHRRARISALRGMWKQVEAARTTLRRVAAAAPADTAAIDAARADVLVAGEALVVRAFETEGPGVRIPEIPRGARPALFSALRARSRMTDAVATSRIVTSPAARRRAVTRAAREGLSALGHLAACVGAVERD